MRTGRCQMVVLTNAQQCTFKKDLNCFDGSCPGFEQPNGFELAYAALELVWMDFVQPFAGCQQVLMFPKEC